MEESARPFPSQRLLQHVVEGVPIRIFWKDRQGRYLGCNSLFAEDSGFSSPGELIGRNDYEMGWREQAELYRADDLAVMESGQPRLNYEECQTTPDGKLIWLRTSKVPLLDDEQHVVGVLGIYEIITEAKRIAEDLRLTQFVSDNAPDGIFWFDATMRICYANHAASDMLGYSEAELLSMFLPMIAPDFAGDGCPEHWRELGGKRHLLLETRYRHRSGRIFPVEIKVNFVEFGNRAYNIAFARDISARKSTEEQLRASERRFRSLVEQSPLAMQFVAPSGVTTEVNRAWEMLWGVPLDALANYNLFEDQQLIDAEIMPQIRRAFAGEHAEVAELEYDRAATQQIPGQQGSFWVRTHLCPIKDGGEEPREVVLIQENVSERKQSVAALVESEQRFRDLFEHSPDPCWIIDENNLFSQCNQAAVDILGYDCIADLRATHPSKVSPELQPDGRSSAEKADEMMAEAHRKGIHRFEWLHRRRDGSCFPVEVTLARFELAGKNQLYCGWRDISERKKMEERMRQSQKMEALGTLVGGLAHDFNNILAAMLGNIELAKMRSPGDARVDDKLKNIEKLANRAADMVRQLLMFTRKNKVEMRIFSFNAFLREGYRLAGTLIPENINQNMMICSEELWIRGDSTQLQQVLMNLLNNAVEAVSDSLSPQIESHLSLFVVNQEFRKRHPDLRDELYACLRITDNGYGVPFELQEKIFEPFFTTKEVGKGTGLGLAIVYGVVQAHFGAVDVESTPGEGTTFCLYLPLCSDQPEENRENTAPGLTPRKATVLLVDDNSDMRKVVSDVLSYVGYRVLEAENGENALELFRSKQGEIELIITDIVMPKMGGIELVEQARKLKEKLPTILMTGYDRDQASVTALPCENCLVLNKPFKYDILLQAVHTLVEAEIVEMSPHR